MDFKVAGTRSGITSIQVIANTKYFMLKLLLVSEAFSTLALHFIFDEILSYWSTNYRTVYTS